MTNNTGNNKANAISTHKKISTIALSFILLTILGSNLSYAQALPSERTRVSSSSKALAQRYIEIVANSSPLSTAVFGVMAKKISGDTIANINCMQSMIPASNMKLISTGIALKTLGKDFRWKTEIACSGTIDNGILNGDLYIIGGGDPTIGAEDGISIATDALFASWAKLVAQAGIKSINGYIIGDGRYFEGPIENDSWQYQDLGTYYGSGGNGLCFYRNTQDINVNAGATLGDSISIRPIYPETPWINFYSTATTSTAGTGDDLYLFNTDLAPIAEMRGTFAIDMKPKKEQCSNKFGAMTCAYYFRNHLISKGISSTGYADIDAHGNIRNFSDGNIKKAAGYNSLNILGNTMSPTNAEVCRITNHISDNFYAETLMRTVGKHKEGSAEYSPSIRAFVNEFKAMNLNIPQGIQLTDGSGLSRKNYISPEFFCNYLKAMAESEAYDAFIYSLGQPGKGEYASRLQGESESVKSRIYYKSGSMNGVRCFSGYVMPADGNISDTIVFSVMLNNCPSPSWRINPVIDKIIALIASEN